MKLKYLVITFLLAWTYASNAQNVDIQLRNTGSVLEVWITPKANYNALVSSVVFTISWAATYNLDLGAAGTETVYAPSTLPLQVSGNIAQTTISNGSRKYRVYTSGGAGSSITLTNNVALKIMSVPIVSTGNNSTVQISIDNDAFINTNNFNYYFETSGTTDITGTTSSTVTAITLPLELTTFSGNTEGSSNRLNWTTKAERHVAQFTIERSFDGQNDWQTLGLPIKAVGNSSTTQAYSFLDNKPFELGYYRLKTLDFDGKTTFLSIISIQRPTAKRQTIKLSPNPTTNWLNLEFDSREAAAFTATIVDIQGRIVLKTAINGQIGLNYSALNVAQLPSGLYNLTLSSVHQKTTKQFIKQ